MNFKWLPVVDTERCSGCGLCVEHCAPKCLAMADTGVAFLSLPDICGSEEHCIAACPDDAIRMAWVPFSGDRSIGRWILH
jgi:MinD superfamily P-loop ATPase